MEPLIKLRHRILIEGGDLWGYQHQEVTDQGRKALDLAVVLLRAIDLRALAAEAGALRRTVER